MANTCDTAYKLYGSKESINSIWNVLTEMGIEEDIVWLWDLAEHCGIDYEERGYSVRGNIWSATCPETEDEISTMVIRTETAWVGCHEVVRAIIEKAGGEDISISYMEIEPGCEVFCIHDEQDFFPFEYYATASGIFEDIEGVYTTMDEAIEAWAEAADQERLSDNNEMMKVIERFNEEHMDDGDYFKIYEFKAE